MKTATYVRSVSWSPEADQALYRLSRPLRYAGEKFDHVVVSLISAETSVWTKHREVAIIPSDRWGHHYGFHSIHYVHQQWEALEDQFRDAQPIAHLPAVAQAPPPKQPEPARPAAQQSAPTQYWNRRPSFWNR